MVILREGIVLGLGLVIVFSLIPVLPWCGRVPWGATLPGVMLLSIVVLVIISFVVPVIISLVIPFIVSLVVSVVFVIAVVVPILVIIIIVTPRGGLVPLRRPAFPLIPPAIPPGNTSRPGPMIRRQLLPPSESLCMVQLPLGRGNADDQRPEGEMRKREVSQPRRKAHRQQASISSMTRGSKFERSVALSVS